MYWHNLDQKAARSRLASTMHI